MKRFLNADSLFFLKRQSVRRRRKRGGLELFVAAMSKAAIEFLLMCQHLVFSLSHLFGVEPSAFRASLLNGESRHQQNNWWWLVEADRQKKNWVKERGA